MCCLHFQEKTSCPRSSSIQSLVKALANAVPPVLTTPPPLCTRSARACLISSASTTPRVSPVKLAFTRPSTCVIRSHALSVPPTRISRLLGAKGFVSLAWDEAFFLWRIVLFVSFFFLAFKIAANPPGIGFRRVRRVTVTGCYGSSRRKVSPKQPKGVGKYCSGDGERSLIT